MEFVDVSWKYSLFSRCTRLLAFVNEHTEVTRAIRTNQGSVFLTFVLSTTDSIGSRKIILLRDFEMIISISGDD